jgi:hypothetical protein
MPTAGCSTAQPPALLSLSDEHLRADLVCADTRGAGRPASRAPRGVVLLVGYLPTWSPAVAEITGAGREWTVAMISELSMPCR